MEDVYDYIHVGGFAAFGLGALVLAYFTHGRLKKVAIGNAIPLLVTSLTYLVLRSNPDRPELRWLGYTVACAFFAFETAFALRQTKTHSVAAAGLMAITLFTGFVTYFLQKWLDVSLLYGLGSITYLGALWFILFGSKEEQEKKPSVSLMRGGNSGNWAYWFQTPALNLYTYEVLYFAFFVISWSVYPIIFGLGPAFGDVISQSQENLAYFVLEFFAKYAVAAINIFLVYSKGREIIPQALRQQFLFSSTRNQ